MSSLSNNNTVAKSMNGLIVIDADTVNSSEIDVDTLVINISGTAPTIANPLDYSTNIATTEWVTNHAGVGYVTLNTSQTLTSGIKTFTNLPECSTSATTNNQFVNLNKLNNAISTAGIDYVHITGTETITGEKTFSNANTYINNTLTANTITATGDLTLNPVGSINCNGKTIDMTGGEIHKCPLIHSQNNNNIVVEALGTGDIVLKTNGVDRVTVADNGITTFTLLPQCSSVPSTGNDLINKSYGDATYASGAGFVTLSTTQSISGAKTYTTNTLKAEAGITVKNGASAQNATLTHNTTTLDVIGTGDISIKPTNDFNVLTGTGKNITVSTPSTSLLQSTQTFTTGITNTSSYIALESPTTYITGLSTQPNLIIAGASGTIYGLKFTRGGTTLAAVNRINCSSTADTFYLEVNSGTQITITNTAVTINPDDTFNMMPTATIIQNVSSTTPSGFLYCNGGAISRTTYSRLFGVIGTTYGVGDGSTTYNKPDFQSVFLRGSGSQTTGGVTYTAGAVGTIQQDAVLDPLYASNEGFRSAAAGARDCVSRDRITADPTDTNTGILPRFDRTATENRPVNHAVYYYIRY
tara:strand:+ start:149 stop:1900 length:1752 start_codon:yes stop_codon:yes gene_type:complete